MDEGAGDHDWVVAKLRFNTDVKFDALDPVDGKITGAGENIINYCYVDIVLTILFCAAAKQEMIKSKLPNAVLGKVWKLADVDKDGMMDADEFALAMHLINIKLDGHELPTELPSHLVPPSKREY
jgi:EH domain-containing protein 1